MNGINNMIQTIMRMLAISFLVWVGLVDFLKIMLALQHV